MGGELGLATMGLVEKEESYRKGKRPPAVLGHGDIPFSRREWAHRQGPPIWKAGACGEPPKTSHSRLVYWFARVDLTGSPLRAKKEKKGQV